MEQGRVEFSTTPGSSPLALPRSRLRSPLPQTQPADNGVFLRPEKIQVAANHRGGCIWDGLGMAAAQDFGKWHWEGSSCDGIILNLADTLLESIAVLNISSIYGGSNIWGENKNKSSHSGNKYPLTTQRKTVTDRKKLKSCIQDFSDRRVEVVGLEGTREMGQIYTGLKNAGKRLAQCTSVIIRTSKMLPMQVDGEPWLQGPCTLEITFKNQVHMLARLPPKPSFFFLKK
uniref:Diacylglycerol kinase gamma n=1 Tax=Monodelphis domestica TaxID=13616 RepID=A0A5F8GRH7_MONDO